MARSVRARDGSLGAEEAQRLLTELGQRAADLSPEDVRRLLLRISSVLVAVAARTGGLLAQGLGSTAQGPKTPYLVIPRTRAASSL